MESLTICLTYGEAIYKAALETDQLQRIYDESREVLEIFKREPDLLEILSSPVQSNVEKKKLVQAILEGKITTELLNFLYILIDKGRMIHYEGIYKVFRTLVDEKEGDSYGIIASAKPLKDEHLAEFEAQASDVLRENVKLRNVVEEGLIGGVKVLIDGKIIDASIKGRLERMKKEILTKGGKG
ncbi:MAG: ATP synthase F1 subunit delta [Anaerovoracaceae bacterium]